VDGGGKAGGRGGGVGGGGGGRVIGGGGGGGLGGEKGEKGMVRKGIATSQGFYILGKHPQTFQSALTGSKSRIRRRKYGSVEGAVPA